MKKIKEIYESLKEPDETVLFQVKSRAILNMMLREFEHRCDSNWNYVYWDKYKEMPLKDIYLFVGKWRLGAAGIFPKGCRWNSEYTHDSFCIDWKSMPQDQWRQKRLVNNFIEVMDKYRKDIKISKKSYEEVTEDQ